MNLVKFRWLESSSNKQLWQELQFLGSKLSLLEFKRYLVHIKKEESYPSEFQVANHVTGENYCDDNWTLPNRVLLCVRRVQLNNTHRWQVLLQEPDWENLVSPSKKRALSAEEKAVYTLLFEEQIKNHNKNSPTTPRVYCKQCGQKDHHTNQCPEPNAKRARTRFVYKTLGAGMPKNTWAPVGNPKDLEESHFGTPYVKEEHKAEMRHEEEIKIVPLGCQCNLCQNWIQKAVVSDCCYSNCCWTCIQPLLETKHECPFCHLTEFQVFSNPVLQKSVDVQHHLGGTSAIK